jgi:hypothetical protein
MTERNQLRDFRLVWGCKHAGKGWSVGICWRRGGELEIGRLTV